LEEKYAKYEHLAVKTGRKSTITLDLVPQSDEINLDYLDKCVRGIHIEGLLWTSSTQIKYIYTLKALRISAIIEDDLVNFETLETAILEQFEDNISSVKLSSCTDLKD